MSDIPSPLWRAIYDIQGDAQQAYEGDRPCYSVEEAWARIEKALPNSETAAERDRLLKSHAELLRQLKQTLSAIETVGECLGDMQGMRDAIANATPSTARASHDGESTDD